MWFAHCLVQEFYFKNIMCYKIIKLSSFLANLIFGGELHYSDMDFNHNRLYFSTYGEIYVFFIFLLENWLDDSIKYMHPGCFIFLYFHWWGLSQVDGSFHSPEWHAARLASLKTSHTITWEEYKKKQKVIFFSVLHLSLYISADVLPSCIFLRKNLPV